MDLARVGAGVVLGGTGIAIAGATLVGAAREPSLPVAGLAMAALGVAAGVGLLAAAAWIYHSGFATRHALRIAGWSVLGTVAMAAVLGLVAAYQATVGGDVATPLLSASVVVAVSAAAHALIGVNDVRRIRARQLADQRELGAVLIRLVRHNLRNTAQSLLGFAARAERSAGTDGDDAEVAAAADGVRAVAADLGGLNERIKHAHRAIECQPGERRPVALVPVVDDVVAVAREDYPGAEIVADVPDLTVLAGDDLRTALREAVENAVEHNDDEPWVRVGGGIEDGRVVVTVADDGPGIPEVERAVVTGDRSPTQLEHASGIGLWLAKWSVESYGGEFAIDDRTDGPGTVVRLRFDPG